MAYFQPEGITEYLKPKQLKGKEFLILNDIHLPYHNKKALNTALDYLKEVDSLVLNGDIIDFYGISRFVKNPKKSFIKDEIEITKDFLSEIRKSFKGKIYFKEGNHEDRLNKYVYSNAPALYGLESVSLQGLLCFKDFNIERVDSIQLMKVSSLYVLHGHEIFGGAGMVNIALSYYRKAKENIIFGHRHQTQKHSGKSLSDKIKGSWAVGCLCDLNPRYMPVNEWNHGFARVSKINEKEFLVKNYEIINGKAF